MLDSISIRIIGPREFNRERHAYADAWCINTASHAKFAPETRLSPFSIGPVPLYDGTSALRMENAWQYAKVYRTHLDSRGEPCLGYYGWARAGWRNPIASRYPMGKGAKPAFLLWGGEHLGYIEARKRIYFTLYRNAVIASGGFNWLRQRLQECERLVLFDFDGYDHDALGMNLADVVLNDKRPMGHAFVLKMMLIYGANVSAEDVIAAHAAASLTTPSNP